MWTGGSPSDSVNLVLIDQEFFAVAMGFGVEPNTGSRTVIIPASEGPTGSCGREFRFYVEDVPVTSWNYGPVFTVICTTSVAIDVKPGGFPNSVNLTSEGTTPVAVLGSSALDVSTIDITTLRLGAAEVEFAGKSNRLMCSVADVSGDFSGGPGGAPDGFADLVCHFVTASIVPEDGGGTVKLTGQFTGGGAFEGADSIVIVRD